MWQYRWHGSINWDGRQQNVAPGDKLFAVLQLVNNSYAMSIRVKGSVNMTINEVRPTSSLEGLNFTNVYFVIEHHSNCNQLPPTNQIVYSNIRVFCNGNLQFTPQWTTAVGSSPICGARAVVQSPSTIALTWNTASLDSADAKAANVAARKAEKPAHN